MMRVRLTNRYWASSALAVLLLCAQVFALHHDFEHQATDGNELCTTCSVGAGVKHLAAAPETILPCCTAIPSIESLPDRVTTAPETLVPEARAPPVHT